MDGRPSSIDVEVVSECNRSDTSSDVFMVPHDLFLVIVVVSDLEVGERLLLVRQVLVALDYVGGCVLHLLRVDRLC